MGAHVAVAKVNVPLVPAASNGASTRRRRGVPPFRPTAAVGHSTPSPQQLPPPGAGPWTGRWRRRGGVCAVVVRLVPSPRRGSHIVWAEKAVVAAAVPRDDGDVDNKAESTAHSPSPASWNKTKNSIAVDANVGDNVERGAVRSDGGDEDEYDGGDGGETVVQVRDRSPSAKAHPWGRFLTGTALVASALVVLGSIASPWPVAADSTAASATFTFALMKRLAAVWLTRKAASWILANCLQPAVAFTAARARNVAPAARAFKRACRGAAGKFKANPRGIMLIPVIAAAVGWLTNWLAVKMIFYPIAFVGVPIAQMVEGELYGYNILNPLGWFGWQGIVPAKAAQMAHTMVTMVTTQLIDVREVFTRLNPNTVATLLGGEVPAMARGIARDMAPGWAVDLGEKALPGAPGPLLANIEGAIHRYLSGFTVMLQEQVHRVVDLKELVVTEMCEDKRTIVELFQRCGREELKFLTNSGLFFGFLLGLIQMVVWLFYDNPWTLTIGGTIVGYLTNWLALKCIFEPVEPVYLWGRFKIQGLFLQRQTEVSREFSDHLASKVLTSEKIWDNMLTGRKGPEFEAALEQYTREFVVTEAAYHGRGLGTAAEDTALLDAVVASVKERLSDHVHVLHAYSDDALGLKDLMREKMALMTPQEFERVLHPIFEADELTLIVSGAVLGAIAGFIQQVYTVAVEGDNEGEGVNEGEPIAVR